MKPNGNKSTKAPAFVLRAERALRRKVKRHHRRIVEGTW